MGVVLSSKFNFGNLRASFGWVPVGNSSESFIRALSCRIRRTAESWSITPKPRGTIPASTPRSANIFRHSEWKVPIHIWLLFCGPSKSLVAKRVRSSVAALLVKVTANTADGLMSRSWIRCAAR